MLVRRCTEPCRARHPRSRPATRIEIAADEASAMVETRATLGLPGVRMTFRSRDKLIRKRWKTLIERSEGTAWVGPAYE
ncbi:hypothetical protein XTG_002441 [Xanthomonas euroxanthea]|nr:hypothetical protein XTG_002441 [Xanthomonas euroxanthea]